MSIRFEPSSNCRMLRAVSTCPGCGRSACTSSRSAPLRPAKASRLMAAARSAVASSFSVRSRASTAVASICAVPLFSARPSFSDRRTGSMPIRPSASPPLTRSPLWNASPRPSKTMARCDSGARSPLAPTEPLPGITGITSLLSKAVSASSVLTRIPECPRNKVLMRMASIARTTSMDSGSPTHTACVISRLFCNSSSRLPWLSSGLPPGKSSRTRWAPSNLSALLPKPVVMPYTGSPPATFAARKSAARLTRASAAADSETSSPSRAIAHTCRRVSEVPSSMMVMALLPNCRSATSWI